MPVRFHPRLKKNLKRLPLKWEVISSSVPSNFPWRRMRPIHLVLGGSEMIVKKPGGGKKRSP